jgi:hypothetical protein
MLVADAFWADGNIAALQRIRVYAESRMALHILLCRPEGSPNSCIRQDYAFRRFEVPGRQKAREMDRDNESGPNCD